MWVRFIQAGTVDKVLHTMDLDNLRAHTLEPGVRFRVNEQTVYRVTATCYEFQTGQMGVKEVWVEEVADETER